MAKKLKNSNVVVLIGHKEAKKILKGRPDEFEELVCYRIKGSRKKFYSRPRVKRVVKRNPLAELVCKVR